MRCRQLFRFGGLWVLKWLWSSVTVLVKLKSKLSDWRGRGEMSFLSDMIA
jgi:hypothetical protein